MKYQNSILCNTNSKRNFSYNVGEIEARRAEVLQAPEKLLTV